MKKLISLIALFFLMTSISFGASLKSMSKGQIKQMLYGKTITTIALTTLKNQMISDVAIIHFAKDGQLKGRFTHRPHNEPDRDQGTWMIKPNGALCVTWQHWTDNQPKCVYGYKLNNGILFTDMHANLETIVLNDNIVDSDQVH